MQNAHNIIQVDVFPFSLALLASVDCLCMTKLLPSFSVCYLHTLFHNDLYFSGIFFSFCLDSDRHRTWHHASIAKWLLLTLKSPDVDSTLITDGHFSIA